MCRPVLLNTPPMYRPCVRLCSYLPFPCPSHSSPLQPQFPTFIVSSYRPHLRVRTPLPLAKPSERGWRVMHVPLFVSMPVDAWLAHVYYTWMGGDLGVTGGTVPLKIWGGGRPICPSPNISRSSVTWFVWKYELSKKVCHQEIFVLKRSLSRQEKGFFLSRKSHIRVQKLKTGKNWENVVDD